MFGAASELRPEIASVARYATWLTSPRNVARNRPDDDVVVAGRECDEGRLERALVGATNRPELAFRVRIAVSAYRRARRAVMTETASVENAVRDCLGRVGRVKGACAAALLLMECEERRVSRGDTVGAERLVREALGAAPPFRPDTPGPRTRSDDHRNRPTSGRQARLEDVNRGMADRMVGPKGGGPR